MIPLWNEWLSALRDTFSEKVYHVYFARLRPLGFNAGRMTLQVPAGVDLQAIAAYKALAQMTYTELTQQPVEIEFVPEVSAAIETPKFAPMPRAALNDRHTFKSFVIGKNSEFAFHAAAAVGENPGGTRFNPLFIYGGPGLGKTHLLHAIGHRFRELNPDKTLVYISAEDFVKEFVDAIRSHNSSHAHEFTEHYRRQADILLMDDIQNLAGRDATQTALFHVFNALHQSGKQLVFTSDTEPGLVKGLEQRLISRFQWGLSVDIQPPDIDTREAILRRKAEEEHLELPDDVISYMARTLDSNVRTLEGAITKLMFRASVTNADVTLDMARDLNPSTQRSGRPRANVDDVVAAVAEFYNVDGERVLESGRGSKEIALARQVAMALLKDLTGLSLKSIGARFAGRDHSTVVHAVKTVQKLTSEDRHFAAEIAALKSKLEE